MKNVGYIYNHNETKELKFVDIESDIQMFNKQHTDVLNDIRNKRYDYSNVKANKTYGTNRLNAYEIIERTLNLKDIKIFDTVKID